MAETHLETLSIIHQQILISLCCHFNGWIYNVR